MLDRRETKENLRAGFPIDKKHYSDDYDYDADSDLEEDEDLNSSGAEDSQVVPEGPGKSDQSDSSSEVPPPPLVDSRRFSPPSEFEAGLQPTPAP